MTPQEFIIAIAPYCVKYAQKYGFKVASPAIAQACLESAYGTSEKAKHHNYFGLKYRPNRLTVNNGTFIDGSYEQEIDGSYYAITDQWYNFDTMEQGVAGYYEFLNITNYAKVKTAETPLEYLQSIKDAGYATSNDYVSNVYKVIDNWNLTKYDDFSSNKTKGEVNMGNSSLIDCTIKSPNHSGQRTHSVDRITPHCVVGQLTAEGIGNCFPAGREASCNYGIGRDGRVCLVVDEDNRSWCSSSNANDQRAITIECASDATAPYAFNDAVYDKLVKLCVDICKRYGKTKLLWIDDKTRALAYQPAANEMLLTVHRWFAAKACPGDWMMARMGDLASKVTAQLGSPAPAPVTPATTTNSTLPGVPFTVDVIVPDLNIRTGADGDVTGNVTGIGRFTITEVSSDNEWGRLKSGAGWIYLANASYVKIGSSTAPAAAPAVATENTASNSFSHPEVPFIVDVIVPDLNIRKTPDGDLTGKVTGLGRFTITEVSEDWGRLKSGAGWIYLGNPSYVKMGNSVAGISVTTQIANKNAFLVQVTADALNVRQKPTAVSRKTGAITDKGVYTIVEIQNGWGRLKSGLGWINLGYTKKL